MPTNIKSSNAGLKMAKINQKGSRIEIMRHALAPEPGGKPDRLWAQDGYFSISGGLCLNDGAVYIPMPRTKSNISTGLITEKIIQKGKASTVMRHIARNSACGNHYRSLQVLRP